MKSQIFKLFFYAYVAISVQSSLANANVALQQNGSLPLLSERANGVNSRYLSAASTASLAAATVAASNSVPQGSAPTATANNQQESGRNYLAHQQQQSQINTSTNNQNQAIQSQNSASQTQHSANPTSVQSAQQYTAVQNQQLNSGTPVLTTTLAFNPSLGQFVPSELTTGSIPSSVSAINPYYVTNGQPVPLVSFAQFGGQQPAPQGIYNRQPSRNTYNQLQEQQVNFLQNQLINPYNEFISPQRQNIYTRRNGYSATTNIQASRLGSLGNNNQLLNQQQTNLGNIDDESGYFQQQNGQNANGLNLDQNSNNGLDALFGNLPTNSYLFGQNPQLQQQQQVSQSNNYNQRPFDTINPLSQSSSSVTPLTSTVNTFGTGTISQEHKSDQCVAADNRHGTCYQASECIRRGGTPMGKCGSNSNEHPGSSYVCCLFDVTCGQFAAERFVYFRNPNYPNSFDQSRMCRAKIGKLDKGTCQFRLEMNRFDVAKPTNGNCSNDMFVVSGQNENYVIPKICGFNEGQHYYVGVDESGVITLHMMMMGYYRRFFEILITQIPCRSDYAAPAHCLQYYMGTHGTIKSFNYDDDHLLASSSYDIQQQDGSSVSLNSNPTAPYGINFGQNQLQNRQQLVASPSNRYNVYGHNSYYSNQDFQFGGYPNDLDYTMCIRKESGFCSITYQLSRTDQGLQPFAVGHSIYGANDSSLGSWNGVSTECRDDYLLIGGVRLCSGNSNGQYPVVGSGSGIAFDSNSAGIQFAQNGSVLNSAGISGLPNINVGQQYRELQNQYNLVMQQLARMQQQQQSSSISTGGQNIGGNNSNSANGFNNPNNQQPANSSGSQSLDQQQAALIQQSMLIQQQMNLLTNNPNPNNRFNQQSNAGQYPVDNLQGAIITDTTSGPFILRFVSNLARNARGFHIDYRQNPCK